MNSTISRIKTRNMEIFFAAWLENLLLTFKLVGL